MQRLLCLFLLALTTSLAAGCAQSSAPRQDETPRPTVTFADPVQAARDAHNVAFFLDQTATAVQQNAVATQAVIVAATQQVEQFNAQATQQAVSVAATATAAQLALQGTAQAVTATAQALAAADVQATAMAQQNERARRELDRQHTQDDLARAAQQTEKTAADARALIGVIGTGALVYAAYVGVIMLERFLDAWIRERERAALVRDIAGLPARFNLDGGGWEPLPGVVSPALPAPEAEPARPEWLARLEERRTARYPEADALTEERRQHDGWAEALRRFLAWGELPHPVDGLRIGYSMRRWRAATGCTQADWTNAKNLALKLGLLVSSNGTYARDPRANAGAILAASFDLPAGVKLPEIPETFAAAQQQTVAAEQRETPAGQNATFGTQHNGQNTPNAPQRPDPPEIEVVEGEVVGAFASRLAVPFDFGDPELWPDTPGD